MTAYLVASAASALRAAAAGTKVACRCGLGIVTGAHTSVALALPGGCSNTNSFPPAGASVVPCPESRKQQLLLYVFRIWSASSKQPRPRLYLRPLALQTAAAAAGLSPLHPLTAGTSGPGLSFAGIDRFLVSGARPVLLPLRPDR